MNKLALHGGTPTINFEFNPYRPLGNEEINAATKVLNSGNLSGFIGAPGDNFLGGPRVRELEEHVCNKFKVKHAISVNSWTSGLICAIGALNLDPGDEIILPCWTMCACATSIIHWNCIPVFADIDPETYCISPESIVKNITDKTKALMVVDIGGQPVDYDAILSICKKYDLKLICDSAQAPGTYYNNTPVGNFGDVGGFSLNYHKHIHCGEGGIIVTNDDKIANRCSLIRNHGENCIKSSEREELSNIIGYNFRLGEIEAAIGIEQLKKLDDKVDERNKIASKLSKGLESLNGLILPKVSPKSTHAFYMYFMQIDYNLVHKTRDEIYNALSAEGLKGITTKFANLHLLPMFQSKIAYGKKGHPWTLSQSRKSVDYRKGICPNAEKLHDETYLGFQMCLFELNDKEIKAIIETFNKVWFHLGLK